MDSVITVRLKELHEAIQGYLFYQMQAGGSQETEQAERFAQEGVTVQTVLLISLMRELLHYLTPQQARIGNTHRPRGRQSDTNNRTL